MTPPVPPADLHPLLAALYVFAPAAPEAFAEAASRPLPSPGPATGQPEFGAGLRDLLARVLSPGGEP